VDGFTNVMQAFLMRAINVTAIHPTAIEMLE
jgi:hypothetical protein